MKIGIDARSLLGGKPRGEGKTLLRLYQEILKLRPDWRTVFYTQGPSAPLGSEVPGARVVAMDPPGFRWNTWENFALPFRLLGDRVNLFHAASSGAPRWLPVPIVLTVHDIIPLVFNDGLDQDFIQRFRARLVDGVRHARAIIVVSGNTKRDLCERLRVNPEHVHVIPWGIDVPAGIASGELPPHVRAPYVLCFGGAAKRKNTLGTLRAFVATAQTLSELQLVFVGLSPGPLREEVHAIAASAGIADRVLALDYISESQLDALYRGALCLLYLSLYEGFGLPLLEAMARGVPVIASNRSSIPEVVGDTALVVDPEITEDAAQALVRVASDPALRAELSQEGRLRAQRFSWQDTASRTVELFCHVRS